MSQQHRDGLRRLHRWQDGACYWCGRHTYLSNATSPQAATRDHVIPKSLGGPGSMDNIVLACRACNGSSGQATDWVPFKALPQWAGLVPPAQTARLVVD